MSQSFLLTNNHFLIVLFGLSGGMVSLQSVIRGSFKGSNFHVDFCEGPCWLSSRLKLGADESYIHVHKT